MATNLKLWFCVAAAVLLAAAQAHGSQHAFFASNGVGLTRWDGATFAPVRGAEDVTVTAFARFNGDVVIGGDFDKTTDGVVANNVARWNGAAWAPLGLGLSRDYAVNDVAVHALTSAYANAAAGRAVLVAAGAFSYAADTNLSVSNVAQWDGSVWAALGSGVNSDVFALAVFNGDLVAGGKFTQADGRNASGIARWDGQAWHAMDLTTTAGTMAIVSALTVFDNALIAAWAVEGNWDAIFSVQRWNGTAWAQLGGGFVGNVLSCLAVFQGTLLVGGSMTGVQADGLGRWVPAENAWVDVGGTIAGGAEAVYAMAVVGAAGDLLVVGGHFTSVANGTVDVRNIAAWDGRTWSTLGAGSADNVYALFDDSMAAAAVPENAPLSGGAIAAITLAVIAVVAALGTAAYYWRRRLPGPAEPGEGGKLINKAT